MEFLITLGLGPFVVIAVLAAMLFVALALVIITRGDLNRLQGDCDALMEYLGNGETRDILHELTGVIHAIDREHMRQAEDLALIREMLASCVQKVAIVRYNAFQSIGSDLSYSIALLDSNDDGVVLSGIYGRESSTSYAKPILAGTSDYTLTEEEESAILAARRHYIERQYYDAARSTRKKHRNI